MGSSEIGSGPSVFGKQRDKELNWDDVVKGCGSGLFSSQLFLSQTLDFS